MSSSEYETDDYYPSHDSEIDSSADSDGSNSPKLTRRRNGGAARRGIGASKASTWYENKLIKKSNSSATKSSASSSKSKKCSARSTRARGKTTKKGRWSDSSSDSNEYETDSALEDSEDGGNKKVGVRKKQSVAGVAKGKSKSILEGSTSSSNEENKSDDDDDSDDPFKNLSRCSTKRRQMIETSSDSDDSSDDDDSIGFGRTKKKGANCATKKKFSDSEEDSDVDMLSKSKVVKASTATATAATRKTKAVDSDSDDTTDFSMGNNKKSNQKVAAATNNAVSLLDSDDDTGNLKSSLAAKKSCKTLASPARRNPSRRSRSSSNTPVSEKKPAAKSPSAKKNGRKTPPSRKSSQDVLDILSSDDDNDAKPAAAKEKHDPSIRATSTLALEKAKAAREALRRAQRYHAEDVVVDLPTPPPPASQPHTMLYSSSITDASKDVVDVGDGRIRVAAATLQNANCSASYSGPIIRISLRYKGSLCNKEINTTLKLKTDEPLQCLADRFRAQHESWIAGTSSVDLNFDGQIVDLKRAPKFYEMEDEDLIDVVIKEGTGVVFKGGYSTATRRYGASPVTETVVIHVRRKGESNHHTFQLRSIDPLSKLVTACCTRYHVQMIVLEYNGRPLDPLKSPHAEGILTNVYLDAVVSPGSVSAPSIAMGGSTRGSGRSLKLKFRFNGKEKDVITMSVPFKGQFLTAMNQFAERKKVALANCQFIVDGEVLNPTTTPESLDLDDDDLIDVQLIETAVAFSREKDNDGDVIMVDADNLGARPRPVLAEMFIETNRNVRPQCAHISKLFAILNPAHFSSCRANLARTKKIRDKRNGNCPTLTQYPNSSKITSNTTNRKVANKCSFTSTTA